MLKFISRTLLSMVMEPEVRDKLEKISQAKKSASLNYKPPMDKAPYVEPDDTITVNLEKPVKVNAERRELIRKALEVQRSKSIILEDLSSEEKLKLKILANEIFKNPSASKKR